MALRFQNLCQGAAAAAKPKRKKVAKRVYKAARTIPPYSHAAWHEISKSVLCSVVVWYMGGALTFVKKDRCQMHRARTPSVAWSCAGNSHKLKKKNPSTVHGFFSPSL